MKYARQEAGGRLFSSSRTPMHGWQRHLKRQATLRQVSPVIPKRFSPCFPILKRIPAPRSPSILHYTR